ncbi:Putative adhesin [Agrococcus baldri]|uniref:Adhesin n=1 Tax=Agrococcus baldri TaxID=153730 RepID=A0AA94HPC2_9MICO|nr:DUF4097 family beta strand repeat-containing protein [Agrococcus baldri]SFS17872.1 Putative adhesin [Agrococcus baldri]
MTIPTPTSTSRPGRWISIVVIVLGAIAILYGVGGGVLRGFGSHQATSNDYSADASGVEELHIDSSASAFEIRFADVDEATLEVTTNGGPVQQWRLEREGDVLSVDTDWRWNWLGFGIILGDRVGEERAVLTLPAELEHRGLGLEVGVSAGSFEASGDWGAASVELSAGDVDLAGTAESLAVEVSAGEARIEVGTAGAVDLDVSAGRIVGSLSGEQPASIDARVSAGRIDLSIPDGEYAVTEETSAGSSDVHVVDDPSATSTIDVQVSAGNVTLRGEGR